mgnify:CR=1 FL=1
MGDLEHANIQDDSENKETIARNTRVGIWFFLAYLVLYSGFVLVNTFSPSAMEATPIEGVNLAILYGFALIIAAFAMALIYGWICRKQVPSDSSS